MSPDAEPPIRAGSGAPLPSPILREVESRFGQSFSDVRLHADGAARASAASAGAISLAVGNDIALGAGSPPLESIAGRYVLSHELAHVVQQRRGGASPDGNGHLETAASQAATSFALPPGSVSVSGASSVGVSTLTADEFGKGLKGLVDKLPGGGTEKVWLKQSIDAGVAVVGAKTEVPKQVEAQVELVVGPLAAAPPPAAPPPPPPEPAKPPAPPAKAAAPSAPTFEPALWSTQFQGGFAKGVHDQNLQASWKKLEGDLASSPAAKVDFGLGVVAGLPTAAGSMGLVGGDLAMEGVKLRYPGLFDPNVTTVKSDEQLARDFVGGMKQFADKVPLLAKDLALHPEEYGALLGQIAGAKIKADLFLEGPEPGPGVPRGADGRPLPTTPSELFMQFASDVVAKGRLDAPERKMRERGLAFGKAAGDVVLNVALLFIEPEEAAAKTLGLSRDAIQGIKNSRIGREVLAQLELIPELKRMADAQKALEVAQAGAREAAAAAGEARSLVGEAKAVGAEAKTGGTAAKPAATVATPAPGISPMPADVGDAAYKARMIRTVENEMRANMRNTIGAGGEASARASAQVPMQDLNVVKRNMPQIDTASSRTFGSVKVFGLYEKPGTPAVTNRYLKELRALRTPVEPGVPSKLGDAAALVADNRAALQAKGAWPTGLSRNATPEEIAGFINRQGEILIPNDHVKPVVEALEDAARANPAAYGLTPGPGLDEGIARLRNRVQPMGLNSQELIEINNRVWSVPNP